MSKQSKEQSNLTPVTISLEEGDKLYFVNVASLMVADQNGVVKHVVSQCAYSQDLAESVAAFKDTHDKQSFERAAGTLENQCLTAVQRTVGQSLPTLSSILCCSFSSLKEDSSPKEDSVPPKAKKRRSKKAATPAE